MPNLYSMLHTVAAFVLALGVLVIVHELGHYWVARWCGVKVARFSFGWGKPVISWRFRGGETEWAIAPYLIGGYVKWIDDAEGPLQPQDLPRTFARQTVWKRIAIVAAGPAANFLLAIAIYWALFLSGVPGTRPMIGEPAPGSTAAAAGFGAGDIVRRVGGNTVPTWQDLRWALLQHAVNRERISVEVENPRGHLEFRSLDFSGLSAKDLDGDFLGSVGLTRFMPNIRPVIGRVVSGGVAERSGLRPGDEIISVGGVGVAHWRDFVEEIRGHPGVSLEVVVKRAGRDMPAVKVVPEVATEQGRTIGRVGAAPEPDREALDRLSVVVSYPAGEALEKAVAKTWDTSLFSLRMLGKMLVGDVSIKNVSGPITIADYASQSAQVGWITYLSFLALISISIGVLNLLPVPLLDGGHLLYYSVEILKGSPLSERFVQIGQRTGVALLVTLMLLAMYNDINRLISG